MKKIILISFTVLVTLGLMAFGFINWSDKGSDHAEALCSQSADLGNELAAAIDKKTDIDLNFNIGNRWGGTMTKDELNTVKSIIDIIGVREDGKIRDSFKNVWVAILHNDKNVRDVETSAMGQSEIFTAAQIDLLRSLDYSTNIRTTAINRLKDPETGTFREDSLVHYMTIVPENEAEYEGGFDALIKYLKENSKEKTSIIEEQLILPARIFFTVTHIGTVKNVKLVETSGYPTVDEELVKIITQMPQKWESATNSSGEKVDQEFVLSFGPKGC